MNFNGHSILLVEDDSNDILFVQRAFKRVDGNKPIYIVKDGDAAVNYLSGIGPYADRDRYPFPTLILLDLKLPRRSGIETLEWIRQQPGIRRIPVVVLTSSRESIDLQRAYDLGVNSYLVKPVKFEALARMIETIYSYWLQLNEYPPIQPVL
jgi:CheY-like chemotaxis protein